MQALQEISDQLITVLHQLPDEYYTKPISILEQQTIGQQVRHIIDHWQILIDNYGTATVNYANRKRDKSMEQNKSLAISIITSLQKKSQQNDIPMSVSSIDGTLTFSSSYYREMDIATEHIIHHAAIIRMAILYLNIHIPLPGNFGYAPSTIFFKKQQCAQ